MSPISSAIPRRLGSSGNQVLPSLIVDKQRDPAPELRIWTAGCATGEAAYSIGMLVMEALEHAEAAHRFNIRIFATDIDKHSIDYATHGVYPVSIANSVSPERLERFFIRQGDVYHVKRELRDLIVFAPHNVLEDPPFSSLDLIVCRNMLIYVQQEMQQRVLSEFNFALSPGYLFLGPSETIGKLDYQFEAWNSKWNIFRRKSHYASLAMHEVLLESCPAHPV